jgi:putative ATP-dependent endonuclease of the OLD family
MQIKSIQIKNFRSIKDSGVIADITKIFALIGRNNAGKSSFLKAIQVAFCKREVDVNDFHKDTAEDIEIICVLEKGSVDAKESTEFKILCAREGLKSTYYINGEKKPKKSEYISFLPELLSISDIRTPKDSMTTDGNRTTLLKQIMKLRSNDNADDLNERFSNLSQQMAELKAQESTAISAKITEKFRDVVGEQSFSITITPDIDLEKGIAYKTGITDQDIPNAKTVDILNSGTGLQSMYLLSLLEVFSEMSVKDKEVVLIIEEPEVYLHPTYQRRMFAALRRIADQNQVIYTTHSPIMIADIWLTKSVRQICLNENGETQVESVKVEDVIDELGIRFEDVLNPKLVVFVEGDDDVVFYEKLGIKDPKLRIIATDGFRAIHYYAFIKIISSEHVKNEFILIADSDGEDPEQRKEKLKTAVRGQFKHPPADLEDRLKERIFILNNYALESYFLNEMTLTAAFPAIDAASIQTFLSEYETKYKEQMQKVRAGHLDIGTIQRYLKPKVIFETIRNTKYEEEYRNFWAGSNTFLTVKGLIAQSCQDISRGGGDPFLNVLDHANLEDFADLVELKKSVLALLSQ